MSNDLKQSAENFILSEVSPSSPDWRTTVEWMVDFAENQLANERERREVAESEALKYKTALESIDAIRNRIIGYQPQRQPARCGGEKTDET